MINVFLKLEKKLLQEIGYRIKEIPETWEKIPAERKEIFFKKLRLGFHTAREEMGKIEAEGLGEPSELAKLNFNRLPKIIQIYIKLAFDHNLKDFTSMNISFRLEAGNLPLNY